MVTHPRIGTRHLQSLLVKALKSYLTAGKMPHVPEAGILLWNIFMKLAATRTYHMAGPNPISYTEIAAFCNLTGQPLQPNHVEIIRALDDAWLEYSYSKINSGDKGKNVPSGELTAEAFDAVFG